MLRPASPEDAAAIAEVFLGSRRELVPFAPLAHTDDETRAWIEDVLVPAGDVTVWDEGGRVLAFIAVSTGADGGWIEHLYVRPEAVGQGVGSLLLAHAHTTLPRPIRLDTFQANTRARRFYERFGYTAEAFSDGSGNEERCPDVRYVLRATTDSD